MMSSQPSHFDSSSPVHSVASRCHRRFIFPPDCHSLILEFTAEASGSGREHLTSERVVFSTLTNHPFYGPNLDRPVHSISCVASRFERARLSGAPLEVKKKHGL